MAVPQLKRRVHFLVEARENLTQNQIILQQKLQFQLLPTPHSKLKMEDGCMRAFGGAMCCGMYLFSVWSQYGSV